MIIRIIRWLTSLVSGNRFLLLILFVVFVLRFPSLFEPHRYADEEIYLTLGQGVRQGLVLYRDIHDNKPPFLYLVAAVAGDLFWLRVILLVVHALGVLFFWKLAEAVFERNFRPTALATMLFALGSTLPPLEGNIANGENFMIVPGLLAAFLFWKTHLASPLPSSGWTSFAIGLLFSVGFLFKVPLAFDFAALLLVWVVFARPRLPLRERFRLLLAKPLWFMVAGFVAPIVLSIVYYSLAGAFTPYVRSALLQNIGYLSTWKKAEGGVLANPLIWRGLILLAALSGVLVFAGRLSFGVRFVVVWLLFSTYGALLSSRPYPHYLLQPLPPFVLLLVLLVSARGLANRLFLLFAGLLVVGAVYTNSFWYYPTLPYYRNFLLHAVGISSWEAYADFWGARRNYTVASYLSGHTSPTERIFVWGTEPAIYVLSRRLPVGRYTVAYHVFDFQAFDETLAAIEATPPPYIVVVDSLDSFPGLGAVVERSYQEEVRFDGIRVLRRR